MTKLTGAALVFFSAGCWCLLRWREGREILELARALLEDLAALGCRMRVSRTPLPEALEPLEGPGADRFWLPLLERLERSEDTLQACWAAAAAELPDPLERILAPLGAMVSVGGARLDMSHQHTEYCHEAKRNKIHLIHTIPLY